MKIMYEFDSKKETKGCINWIKNWFENESGNAKGVIIGISGGKDSTVVASLLCKAIGKEKILGVMMPNGTQRDIEDSRRVCSILDINSCEINIEAAYKGIISGIERGNFEKNRPFSEISSHTKTNIAPRLRMTTLYTIGQELSYRVAGTGNFSEKYVGYATKWGDMANDFNPVANFTTDEVVAIGKELGLPVELVEKAPEDGLSGKTDEDNLGFTYEVLNDYIRTGICKNTDMKEKIDKLHKYNYHKSSPIPTYQPFRKL